MPRVPGVLKSISKRCNLQPNQIDDAYPCSRFQAGLVAASLQGLADYTSRFVFALSSTSHKPSCVKAAVERIFTATPILRTRFIEQRGTFLQVVVHEDLVWANGENLTEYLETDKQRPLTLGDAVTRFAWIETDDGQNFMVWTLHHAQYDEWSIDRLFAQMSQLAIAEDRNEEVGDPVPFKKFIKAISLVDERASRDFWIKQLPNPVECQRNWSTQKLTNPATTQILAKSFSFKIPEDYQHRPALLALAAWSIVNAVMTKSNNVLFGNITNGRGFDMAGMEAVMGPTIATVPWNIQLRFESTLAEFIQELQAIQSAMLPFEQIGMDAFREVAGYSGFDTLLLVQASKEESEVGASQSVLRPDDNNRTAMRHACYVLLDVCFGPATCELKASYDDSRLNKDNMIEIAELFISIMTDLLEHEDKTIQVLLDNYNSINLSRLSPASESDSTSSETDHISPNDDVEPSKDVKTIVQEVIMDVSGIQNTKRITSDTTLMELGIDSLKTVVLGRRLGEIYKTLIPFKRIAGGKRTILEVAKCIQETQSGAFSSNKDDKLALLEEAKKYEQELSAIQPPRYENISDKANSCLLLTGANGYLGIEILRQCLKIHKKSVIALIRCRDAKDGAARLQKSAELARWSVDDLAELSRVEVWPSDMAKSRLGLANEQWNVLSQSNNSLNLRGIIHCGAKVDFLQTYKDLEKINVTSTADLLSISLQRSEGPNFVYVTGGRPPPPIDDQDVSIVAMALGEARGYPQSKFVGEQIVKKANSLTSKADSGPRMAIVHPGLIIGSNDTGVASGDDFLWRYVAASILMGYYVSAVPTKREWINVGSVDEVAATTVKRVLQNESSTELNVDNIRSGLLVSDFWPIVLSALEDVEMEEVSEQEWLLELEDSIEEHQEDHPLFSLSELMLRGTLKGFGSVTPRDLSSTDVSESLAEAVRSNVRYLRDVGFFPGIGPDTLQPMFGRSKF